MGSYRIGTAGWSISKRHDRHFGETGTHLQRYASRLDAVEINSSFYGPHRRETYERWAASVPKHFRFSVKIPKAVTHECRLAGGGGIVDVFLEQIAGLGEKLGVLLVQLPPSLSFDTDVATPFLRALRHKSRAGIACEPRHGSWFGPEADGVLKDLDIARVVADPPPHEGAEKPGGFRGLAYFRMHGSPRIYHSDYAASTLEALAAQMKDAVRSAADVWCIFDNTADGHALGNAVELDAMTDMIHPRA